jgi:hypothetical protein
MPWDAVDNQGRWVEVDDDVAHVVKEIERLWPELRIQYCEDPDIDDYPFMVVERTRTGEEVPVLGVWQLDDRLIELLHNADTTRHDVLGLLDKSNSRAIAARTEKLVSWRDYCRDVILRAGRSPGSSYTFKDPRPGHEGEIVKITDDPNTERYGWRDDHSS